MEISDLIKPLKKLAKTSKARLGGTACFAIKNGAIISSGVNHNPTGEQMEDEVDGKLVSRPEVIHAEVATINAARKNDVDLTGAVLLMAMSPCINCAREICGTGAKEIYYLYEWWDAASIKMLNEHGIKTVKLKEEK